MTEPASSEPPRLGTLEQQVMDILWDHGGLTIRQIIDHLPHDAAYTTIATVLGNLERKEMVLRQREGRSTHYRPRRSREEHAAQLMGHALASSGDRAASMLHFVDAITPSDAELLRSYLARGDAAPEQ